jgi:starch synthase
MSIRTPGSRSTVYVVMVASECAPAAKAGGLGDVVFGLSREVEVRGHAVEIVLPRYEHMRYQDIWGFQVSYEDLWVPWFGGAIRCTVWFGFVHGRRCFFIEPHSAENFFGRAEAYGYDDDVDRFAFFSKAALEFLLRTNKRPDVIHCHDWQTGLLPVLLYEQYQQDMRWQRVCFTIHNFGHQGVTGDWVLWASQLGRPEHFTHPDRLGHGDGAVNLMKGGIVYANFVTTVSPHHAHEVRHGDQGNGLGHTLYMHERKFGGVLNGVDYHTWNPETDPHLPTRYTADDLAGKYHAKARLRERFWLRDRYVPIVAYVGRLDRQKGMHLVHDAIFQTLSLGGQFVLLSNPGHHQDINDHFWWLKHHLNDNPDCHIEIGYTEELAHLVFAGADILVVPSMFEPCGLVPLIALRYGTVPVVRAIGGMVDTIFDRDHSWRPPHERNGYVFHHTDGQALESALHRAIGLWFSYPDEFRRLAVNGMRNDHSWAESGWHYVNIYDHIRHK